MVLRKRVVQYRERSDRMSPLNHRFKSSCDYRVAASGRFGPGTVLSGDHIGVLPNSTDFSQPLTRDSIDLISFNRLFLSNTLIEHHGELKQLHIRTLLKGNRLLGL